MRRVALAPLVLAAVLSSCAPRLAIGPAARPDPGLSVEELRDEYTRAVVPDDLELRWLEATWVDPVWVRAQCAELSRLAGEDDAAAEARLRARLGELHAGEGISFDLWVLTHLEGAEHLDRWTWLLTGPGGRVSTPAGVTSRVLDQVDQTIRIMDVSRVVTLKTVEGVLWFDATPADGTWVLSGSPGRGYGPYVFQWRVSTRRDGSGP